MPRCIFAFMITVKYYCEISEVLHGIFIFGRVQVPLLKIILDLCGIKPSKGRGSRNSGFNVR